jgi:hypothetical protein
MTPPPVSNTAYPVMVRAESRSNFLTGGLVVTGAYTDNIMPSALNQKVGDSNYSIVPMIALDRRTPRQAMSANYTSGFTFYQKNTELNGVSQSGTGSYSFRLSPYAAVSVSDSFGQNSNLFNQSNPFIAGISGNGVSPNSVYIFPFQNQMENSSNGSIQYQYGRNAMLGGGGTYTIQRFAKLSSVANLDDTNIGELSGFWSRRFTPGQYGGIVYQYSKIDTHPIASNTTTNTIDVFYTKYLTRTVSFSVLGGPQHYVSRDPVSGASNGAWTPAIQGSVGYQKVRTSFSADYARSVTGAGGLVGAYHSETADLNARRQITRSVTVGAQAGYALFKNVTPVISSSNPGGHTVSGGATMSRNFREHLGLAIGYARFHQSYSSLQAATGPVFPDSNRVFASISFQFYRPIGR